MEIITDTPLLFFPPFFFKILNFYERNIGIMVVNMCSNTKTCALFIFLTFLLLLIVLFPRDLFTFRLLSFLLFYARRMSMLFALISSANKRLGCRRDDGKVVHRTYNGKLLALRLFINNFVSNQHVFIDW